MNRIFTVFLFLAFLVPLDAVEAQVYDRRGQTIYVELGGHSFVYSLNYETRFSQKTEGLGARIGFSYIDDWWTVPVMINYLLGKRDSNHFLELGIGAVYYDFKEPVAIGDGDMDDQVMGAFAIMYRFHPRTGKFLFRAGITPLLYQQIDADQVYTLPMFGISFGKVF